jgi:hypothetical protein
MRELHNREEINSTNMRRTSFDHPSLDALERFVLHTCSEEELEIVETHILVCEPCVSALENLEVEIAATKLALGQIAAEQRETDSAAERNSASWRRRFALPTLSWGAVGLATCAFALFAFLPASVEMKAERGTGTAVVVPAWRNTHLKIEDEGLPAGALRAEIVNRTGTILWTGEASSANGEVNVRLPRITEAGHYYARLYTATREHDLLSELPFDVKLQF